jgi:hypothetical protein
MATAKTTGAKAKGKKVETKISIPQLENTVVKLTCIGLPESPIVIHAWSEKALKEMRDKHAGKMKPRTKEPRDIEQEWEDSCYIVNGKPAFKTVAFKKAMAQTAATQVEGITKKLINMNIHTLGEFTEVHFANLIKREDVVRLSGIGNPPDLRYRKAFEDWWVELVVEFNHKLISLQNIIDLMNLTGYSCGVAEMRPEKSGDGFGRFRVATSTEVDQLRKGVSPAKINQQFTKMIRKAA